MQLIRRGAGFTALLMLALASTAQEKPIAYPAKGQSAAQQRQDDGERYVWSKQSTGIDPAVLASTPLQSALIGAAGGAAIGGIAVGEAGEAGEAGKGAAIGALVGVSRGIKQKQQQEAEAARRQAMNTFYRAYGACMSGCGYSVG